MHNIVIEQEARYKFASKIVTGKVLDISYGKFMAYYGAKILLDGGASEVWNYDISNEKSLDVRKYHNGNIQFQHFNKNMLDEKFDSIILFESAYMMHDLSSNINNFSQMINDNGVFVISVFNREFNDTYYFSNIKNVEGFTKNQFSIMLTNIFPNVTFYSQLLPLKTDLFVIVLHYYSFMKQLIRKTMGSILLIFDKKSTFYKIRLQKSISRVNKLSENIYDRIFDKKYEPILFEDNHKPTYFIAICKK